MSCSVCDGLPNCPCCEVDYAPEPLRCAVCGGDIEEDDEVELFSEGLTTTYACAECVAAEMRENDVCRTTAQEVLKDWCKQYKM